MPLSVTRWTLIRLAQAGDDEALAAFVGRYRPVLVRHFRSRGLDPDAAEDLGQEALVRFLADGVLQRADPGRGRFRNLLYAVSRHVLGDHLRRRQAKKRGGGQVSALGDADVAAPTDDASAFDREWLLHLLERALARLEAEHPHYHAAVSGVYLDQASYAQVADGLDKRTTDVTNYVYRGKQKLQRYLREAVWDYSTSERECTEELAHLSVFLRGALPAGAR
jgi:RNA polymerase sigma-70 factor (ECF subfamily)